MNDGRRILWAVSTGSYSDYNVKGLFPTKDLAERAAVELSTVADSWHSDAFVESFLLWSEDDMPEVITYYRVQQTWWDDNRIAEEREDIYTEYELALLWPVPSGDRPHVRWVRAPMHNGKGGRIEITGRSLEGCRKVLSEWRARWVAEGPFKKGEIVEAAR